MAIYCLLVNIDSNCTTATKDGLAVLACMADQLKDSSRSSLSVLNWRIVCSAVATLSLVTWKTKPSFVECLLYFWFDVVFRDYIIYLLHRVGAARCRAKLPGCSSGCSDVGSFDGTPRTSPVSTPDDQKQCIVTVMA